MNRKLDLAILGACALLSACVSAPPPPPQAEYQPPSQTRTTRKVHHAHRKVPASAPAEVATACPWPAHTRPSAARLETASTEIPMPAGSSEDTVEGCAVLRFGVSAAGTVTYIDVVSAKPDTVAPAALKCLLATRFKPSHPAEEALIRVELRAPKPDQVVAVLKLR